MELDTGHEGLYDPNSEKHKKAESIRDRRKESEKKALVKHNINLAEKNETLVEENIQLKIENEENKKHVMKLEEINKVIWIIYSYSFISPISILPILFFISNIA